MDSSNLNPVLLLSDPDRYHEALKEAKTLNFDCSSILNDTSLKSGWYSPHVMLLAYLLGDHKDEILKENKTKSEKYNECIPIYWGAEIKNGIPEEKAIEMINLMVDLDADLKVKDYYERDIFYWTREKELPSSNRMNNGKFKKEVLRLYPRTCNF